MIDQSPHSLRLNKAIASSGLCSRRKADELISQGKVAVNGRTVQELGIRVNPSADRVAVDGQALDIPVPGRDAGVTVAMHKPVRVVSTASDPQGRETVVELLPRDLRRQRLVPVGRLDFFSEGLLLLSNSGELIHRLTHPRWHVTKTYQVLISGEVPPGALETMSRGMTLQEGDILAPVRASIVKPARSGTWLEMELHQGVNRQVRRMCRDLDLTVLRLIRIRHGPISLGSLAPGRIWRLSEQEEIELYSLVGLG